VSASLPILTTALNEEADTLYAAGHGRLLVYEMKG
jgi:hypothetical protein